MNNDRNDREGKPDRGAPHRDDIPERWRDESLEPWDRVNALLTHPDLEDPDRVLALFIHRLSQKHGCCWMGQPGIAESLGWSESKVYRRRKRLREVHGVLDEEERRGRNQTMLRRIRIPDGFLQQPQPSAEENDRASLHPGDRASLHTEDSRNEDTSTSPGRDLRSLPGKPSPAPAREDDLAEPGMQQEEETPDRSERRDGKDSARRLGPHPGHGDVVEVCRGRPRDDGKGRKRDYVRCGEKSVPLPGWWTYEAMSLDEALVLLATPRPVLHEDGEAVTVEGKRITVGVTQYGACYLWDGNYADIEDEDEFVNPTRLSAFQALGEKTGKRALFDTASGRDHDRYLDQMAEAGIIE